MAIQEGHATKALRDDLIVECLYIVCFGVVVHMAHA